MHTNLWLQYLCLCDCGFASELVDHWHPPYSQADMAQLLQFTTNLCARAFSWMFIFLNITVLDGS